MTGTPRWRRLVRSAQARILAWYVVLLAFGLTASILVERQVLLTRLDERIAQDLRQEADELRQLIGGRGPDGRCVSVDQTTGECVVGRDPEDGEVFGDRVDRIFTVFLRRNIPSRYETMFTYIGGRPFNISGMAPPYRIDREADPALLRRWATTTATISGSVDSPVGRIDYLAVPLMPADGGGDRPLGVFVVAQFRDLAREEVGDVVNVAVIVGFGTLLVASVVAAIAAGRILAPVRLVTETARTISETDLSRRIPAPGTDDEIATLAATFNGMLERLEDAFATQRNFVDDAGHELRTPITIIRGHLELLGDDPEDRRETIVLVTDELDRMNRMVDDLLVLARLQRPEFLDLETVDVRTLTEEMCTKAPALGARDWQVEAVGGGRIVGDRQRLTQAVMQLAQNATQHTWEGDVIAMGSAVADGEARFWVRDSGPGIDEAERERIFERFARIAAGRRRSEGAGLGLSIVRAIAEAHRGRVEVSGRPAVGATFTIVVPVDRPEPEQPEVRTP